VEDSEGLEWLEREWMDVEEQGDHGGSLSPIYSLKRGLLRHFTVGDGRDKTMMSAKFWA
jgi:hypothetical protein